MNARCSAKLLLLRAVLTVCCASFWGQAATSAALSGDPAPGLRNSVVLIIRHAEKPATGSDLTPAGFQRARAYVDYFKNFKVGSEPAGLDWLFAAADSKSSHRPRLTLEPLSDALGRPLDLRFKAKQAEELAQEMKSQSHGKVVLICWHHGQIPNLIRALGGQAEELLPQGKWPDDVFNWVIELRYDEQGRIVPGQARRIRENLMPGDAVGAQ